VAVDHLLRDLSLAEPGDLQLLSEVLVSLFEYLCEVFGARLYLEGYLVPFSLGDFGLQVTLLLSLFAPASALVQFP